MSGTDLRQLAEELREFTAIKYAGNCKCGACQLVPRAFVERIYHSLNSAGVAFETQLEAVRREMER